MGSEGKSKGRVLFFVCSVLFLDAVGFGLIIPVMPDLLREIADLSNSEGAFVTGALLTTFALTQFFCAPVLGALSDKFGRRPVLLISLAGFALDYFLMAWAPTLAWLFVARFMSGLFGATFAAANASVVDISSKEERAKFFGLAGASLGLGFVFGPAIGGLLGGVHVRLPFVVAGVLTLVVLAYGYFMFPDTLAKDKRRPFSWLRANPVGSLVAISRHPGVLWMLVALFCIQLSNHSFTGIWPFYTKAVTGWGPFLIGVSISFYGVLMVVVQGGLVGPVVKRIGEHRAIYFSFAVGIISFVILSQAASGWQIYAGIAIGCLAGFVLPALQSLMTSRTDETAQGELQGAVTSLYSIAAVISPFAMATVFRLSTDETGPKLPGAPFLLAAALIVMSAVFFSLSARHPGRLQGQNV